jgi:hypothetical protein
MSNVTYCCRRCWRAPFVEALRGNKKLNGALSAITAAVVGVLLNLAIWFALHTIFRSTVPRSYGVSFDMPVVGSADLWTLALSVARNHCDVSFQNGHDRHVNRLLRLRCRSFSGRAHFLIAARK